VQGVGFRWFTQRAADGLRLSGWVRNRRDGTVEAEVVGERAAVQACIDRLREGPPGSAVSRVDVEWAEAPGGSGSRFEIRPTL
jgi:acylphosphatase